MDESVAALMVTNPNTLGLFEEEIEAVAAAVHARGGLVYMDGANVNALMGVASPPTWASTSCSSTSTRRSRLRTRRRPGRRARRRAGVDRRLSAGARLVRTGAGLGWTDDRPRPSAACDRSTAISAFLLRAYAYVARLGGPGLAEVTRLAVLNANYVRHGFAARTTSVRHPVDARMRVLDRDLQDFGVSTLDVAKRLLDYGFYAPTIYFPLVSRVRS